MEDHQEQLIKLVTIKMPFGKYKGQLICDLPVYYLEWFARKGFPEGKLGQYLSMIHDLKTNGDGAILDGLKRLVSDR